MHARPSILRSPERWSAPQSDGNDLEHGGVDAEIAMLREVLAANATS
jgi:hypothetical protein